MKIVITGSANSGKTVLTHTLKYQFPNPITLVPDVLNYRLDLPDVKNSASKKYLNSLFFHMQMEVVNLNAALSPQQA